MEGTVGGGPDNYLPCSASLKTTSEANAAGGEAARTAATETHEKPAAGAKACLEPAAGLRRAESAQTSTRTMRLH